MRFRKLLTRARRVGAFIAISIGATGTGGVGRMIVERVPWWSI
jgi:hypothetical protein